MKNLWHVGVILLFVAGCNRTPESSTTHQARLADDLSEEWSRDCLAFEESEAIRTVLSRLEMIVRIDPPLWSNHYPTDTNYVLTGSNDFRRCALIVTGTTVSERVLLTEPMHYGNGMYVFYPARAEGEVPEDLQRVLSDLAIDRATLFRADADLVDEFGAPRHQVFMLGLDDFVTQTLVHEAFHNDGQIAGENWPDWPTTEDRDDVDGQCYRLTDEVETLYRTEVDSLKMAFFLSSVYDRPDDARVAAQEFIAKRRERYDLLESGSLAPAINCQAAEASMDLVEGTAQFVGLGYGWLVGGIDNVQLANRLEDEARRDYFFYNFGFLELMYMRSIDPVASSSIIEELKVSPDWRTNLFTKFEEFVNGGR